MRLIFMGTPEIAIPSLESIYQSHHQIIAIFTQPDRVSGRGRKMRPPPVKIWALEKEIPIYQPERLRGEEDPRKQMAEKEPDAIVAVAYGLILPKSILSLPPFGCINLHFSLLPKYRGAAPVNWAIVRGERETGVTTFLMNERMDEGDILLQEKVRIEEQERADALSQRLAGVGASLLVQTLDLVERKVLKGQPQDHSQASYAPLIKKEDGKIDWRKTASEISMMVRGFYPWPGAFTLLRSKVMKITEAYPLGFLKETQEKVEEGRVLSLGRDSIQVLCGSQGILSIKSLQPEGRKEMKAKEAINGRYVRMGDQFGR